MGLPIYKETRKDRVEIYKGGFADKYKYFVFLVVIIICRIWKKEYFAIWSSTIFQS